MCARLTTCVHAHSLEGTLAPTNFLLSPVPLYQHLICFKVLRRALPVYTGRMQHFKKVFKGLRFFLDFLRDVFLVLRKRGKLISFLRSFFTSRPTRAQLKQTGIVKERVFGCDLGEHLLNSGHEGSSDIHRVSK